MSYAIGLYDKAFLEQAIAEDLGDWTKAPAIPREKQEAIEKRLIELGYKLEAASPICREWIHPKEGWGLQANLFSSEIAFSIPYWDDWENAVMEAEAVARQLAEELDLGFHDPQSG